MSTSNVQQWPVELQFADQLNVLLHKCQAKASQHSIATMLGIFLFTSVVAVIDYAAGDEVPLMVLYLPAIIASCWLQNIGVGVALSLICSCLWLVDDAMLIEQSPAIGHKYWLALVHFVFFGVVAAMTWKLRLSQERERTLARTDALTGLANRKAFLEAIDVEIARAKRQGEPIAIAYLDCDNFKEVNDTLGHATGDALLLAVSQTAMANVRPTDILARLGGDEFACLLPGAGSDQAEQTFQRVQQRLNAEMQKHDWPVTFSIGIAVFPTAPHNADELIGAADQLMYDVKLGAKNGLKMQEFPAA